MVDFGFEQGLSDFSRSAGYYPAIRDFPPGIFPKQWVETGGIVPYFEDFK
jgi:hypothetical protein